MTNESGTNNRRLHVLGVSGSLRRASFNSGLLRASKELAPAMMEVTIVGSFSVEPEGDLVEPDLPREVAITPDGPLWVSGGITIEMSDGRALETRNRVTLCRCGASKIKPLCDGAHKDIDFKSP